MSTACVCVCVYVCVRVCVKVSRVYHGACVLKCKCRVIVGGNRPFIHVLGFERCQVSVLAAEAA